MTDVRSKTLREVTDALEELAVSRNAEGFPVEAKLVRMVATYLVMRLGFAHEEPEDDVTQYVIWTEGYRIQGERGKAIRWGVGEGTDLKTAALDVASRDPLFKTSFEPDRMTWWGCRIFDNETDARKAFG